jgi:hypothetical protein
MQYAAPERNGDRDMADKHTKGTHNPSQKSLARWDDEGGAPSGGRSRLKRPRDITQLAMIGSASDDVEDRQPRPEERGKDPAAAKLGARAAKRPPK